MKHDGPKRLRCPQCGSESRCDELEMLRRLQATGRLRRAENPESELVRELFAASAGRFRCADCGQVGLLVEDVEHDPDGDWPTARSCEHCGALIGAERVSLMPHVILCVACQQLQDRGESQDEIEYCPHCGSPMTARPTRGGGITRYKMVCEHCKR